MNKKARLIAFYLPQFYPTDLNDSWWGPGYTEWRSVTQARPLFRNHYQPHEPADLGYYDLRLSETREKQAQLAKDAGIEGFCYWHYWMGEGRVLLERPFKEVLESGKPDYPFCLGWANHNWTNKNWTKQSVFLKEENLVEVRYSEEDYIRHFEYVLPAFKDKRYIRVDNKPLFYIWNTADIPNLELFINKWQDLAKKNGLDGVYFVGLLNTLGRLRTEDGKFLTSEMNNVGQLIDEELKLGLDAVNTINTKRAEFLYDGRFKSLFSLALGRFLKYYRLKKYDYRKLIKYMFCEEERRENVWPMILPNWDRSPRAGRIASIYTNTTPEMFKKSLEKAIELVKDKTPEHRIIIIKSWNEWGEGNYLEPDLKYGHAYLDVLKIVTK